MIDPVTTLGATLLPPYPYYVSHTRDIEEFEGPLLTEITDVHKNVFLQYWCDCGDETHRWLVFQASKELITQYEQGKISLRSLMDQSCNNKVIYLREDNKRWLIEYGKLTESYKPTAQSFKVKHENGV